MDVRQFINKLTGKQIRQIRRHMKTGDTLGTTISRIQEDLTIRALQLITEVKQEAVSKIKHCETQIIRLRGLINQTREYLNTRISTEAKSEIESTCLKNRLKIAKLLIKRLQIIRKLLFLELREFEKQECQYTNLL